MQDQICGYCNKIASFICMRCNVEPYCSRVCQVAAFPQHRRECFTIPSLKVIGGSQPLPSNSSEFDDTDKSSVVGLNNNIEPPKAQKPIVVKEQKVVEVHNESVKNQPDVVEGPVKIDQPMQKELITPAFNQGVRTVAPNTYKKSPSVVSIPAQAEKVEEAPKPAPEKKAYGMDQMRRSQQGPMMSKPKEKRFFLKDIKVRQLSRGKQKVRLVNGNEATKIFYVTEAITGVDDFIAYMESNINDFVKTEKSTSYKPLKDEMVLAKFDDIFYRAVVEEIIMDNPNKPLYNVFFVDYGNTSQVTEAEMKPFPHKLASEVVLNVVYLQNFPENMTDKQAEVLADENGIQINLLDQSEDCYIAEIIGI